MLRLMTAGLGFVANDGDDPDDLLLPRIAQTRRGHPLMLAIVAGEIAQRAGIGATVLSSPRR